MRTILLLTTLLLTGGILAQAQQDHTLEHSHTTEAATSITATNSIYKTRGWNLPIRFNAGFGFQAVNDNLTNYKNLLNLEAGARIQLSEWLEAGVQVGILTGESGVVEDRNARLTGVTPGLVIAAYPVWGNPGIPVSERFIRPFLEVHGGYTIFAKQTPLTNTNVDGHLWKGTNGAGNTGAYIGAQMQGWPHKKVNTYVKGGVNLIMANSIFGFDSDNNPEVIEGTKDAGNKVTHNISIMVGVSF